MVVSEGVEAHLSTHPVYDIARAAALCASNNNYQQSDFCLLSLISATNGYQELFAFFLPSIYQHTSTIPACLTMNCGLAGEC